MSMQRRDDITLYRRDEQCFCGAKVLSRPCLSWVDAVEKVADEVGRAVRSAFESLFSSRSSSSFLAGLASLARVSNAPSMLDAIDAQAMHAVAVFSNGRQIWLARVFKFCTMAARWNSSRAPEKPRNRIRSKPWCVFRCAKRISTFLRSLRDLANSGVPIKARVASRASSCTSRGIFRKVILGVHFGLSGHGPQSRVLAR